MKKGILFFFIAIFSSSYAQIRPVLNNPYSVVTAVYSAVETAFYPINIQFKTGRFDSDVLHRWGQVERPIYINNFEFFINLNTKQK